MHYLLHSYYSLISSPLPCQWLWGQNSSVGIEVIELTEPSDKFNYKPFFTHCIFQTVLDVFLLFIFVYKKIFSLKNWAVFCICLICFSVTLGVTVLKFLCFWCSLCKVIGNLGFFTYSPWADIFFWLHSGYKT